MLSKIIQVLDLQLLFVAFAIILDQKTDGDLDLLQIDEKFGEDLDNGFKILIEKASALWRRLKC